MCLFCQARQISIGRRKATTLARRRLETPTTRPDGHGFLLHKRQHGTQRAAIVEAEDETEADEQREQETEAEAEALRQALLEFDTFNKQKALRLEALRNMRNPFPPWNPKNEPLSGLRRIKEPQPPEAAAAPVSHPDFRRLLKEADGSKARRVLLRAQLLRCEHPRDVLRIVAVSVNNVKIGRDLAALSEPIIRAMYRCRNNVTDPEVLRTIRIIAARFDMAGIPYNRHILDVGLKFAARARSLPAMAWFLRRVREGGLGMSSNIFRSVIAKCSIGHRGLGEIRNGRWRREELLEAFTGFKGCENLAPDEQYHLGSFMDREDWQFLHGWVAVLARCRDSDTVWQEWKLWKKAPARLRPRGLNGQRSYMTTKLRGDLWFAEQMTYTKDMKRAWALVEEAGLSFSSLKLSVRSALLDAIEHIPPALWNEEIRQSLLWKYDIELLKIEKALGVTWSSDTTTHTITPGQTQEEALERLAAHNFGAEDSHGFPYDDEMGEGTVSDSVEQRALHDAEEEDEPGARPWVKVSMVSSAQKKPTATNEGRSTLGSRDLEAREAAAQEMGKAFGTYA